jgi:hypothetical protein
MLVVLIIFCCGNGVTKSGNWVISAPNVGCPICPDFLRRLVALIHSMRLSLMKGAHVSQQEQIGPVECFVIQNRICADSRNAVARTCLGCFSSNSREIVILERSEAKWRDLLFLCPSDPTAPNKSNRSTLCHPERTPDLLPRCTNHDNVCGFL